MKNMLKAQIYREYKRVQNILWSLLWSQVWQSYTKERVGYLWQDMVRISGKERKDGRWEGRYPVYSEEKRKQVYCSVYGRTYEEAREKLTTKKNLLKDKSQSNEKICGHRTPIPKEISFTEAAQASPVPLL